MTGVPNVGECARWEDFETRVRKLAVDCISWRLFIDLWDKVRYRYPTIRYPLVSSWENEIRIAWSYEDLPQVLTVTILDEGIFGYRFDWWYKGAGTAVDGTGEELDSVLPDRIFDCLAFAAR